MSIPVTAVAWLLAAAGAIAAEPDRILDTLGNATYQGLPGGPVTLTGGRFRGEPVMPGAASHQEVILARRLVAVSDLDGDGAEDAAAILVESFGGTGSFVYLAAVSLAGGSTASLGTVLLGDRVQIRRLTSAPGSVSVDTVVAGEQDAAAQPSEKVRRTFSVGAGGLAETAAEPQGPLSLADLAGSAWRLREIRSAGRNGPPAVPVTLELSASRMQGHAGCNRFFAEVTDEGRGGLSLGPVGATRMSCPEAVMEQEQAFLGLVAQTEWFGFGTGDLILGTAEGVMLFDPVP